MKNKKLLKYFTEQILPTLDEIEFNDTNWRKTKMENTIYVIYSDFDYAPVAVYTEDKGVLFSGDNIHEQGYSEFADGYASASGREITSIYVDDLTDLSENEDIMRKAGVYEEYKELLEWGVWRNDNRTSLHGRQTAGKIEQKENE